MARDRHSGFLRHLTLTSFLLRAALAVALHLFVSEELFAPDQITYDRIGTHVAAFWAGETLIDPPRMSLEKAPAYFYVVAVLYTVFGRYALIPKLCNALVGSLSVPLVYDIAWRITGSAAAAARAATYSAYFPSLILWSALNIRDAWVIVLILFICREVLLLQERLRPGALLLTVAGIAAVTQFRAHIFYAVVGPVLVSFVVRNRRNLVRNVILGMVLSMVAVYVTQTTDQARGLPTLDLQELQTLRGVHAWGAQSAFEQVDISTPGKALAFLPVGIAYFLLAPFPWMISGIRQILTLPEMLFFYSLIPAIIRGIRELVRRRLSDALMVLLIVAGLTFGYALGEGNAGTAYRHRAQVIGFYLIFAALGVEIRREAQARERAGAGLRPLA